MMSSMLTSVFFTPFSVQVPAARSTSSGVLAPWN